MVGHVDSLVSMKSCSKCKQDKSTDLFQVDKSRNDGLQPYCKSCRKIAQQNYYLKNKDSFNKKQAIRRSVNRDEINQYFRKRYQSHKEEESLRKKIYHRNNPEISNNASARRRVRKLNNGVFLVTLKELKALYNASCFYCGFNANIEIDHVIPISRGGRHSIGNLVPACITCNRSKNNKFIIEWRKNVEIL